MVTLQQTPIAKANFKWKLFVTFPGGNVITIIREINNKNNWVQYTDLFQQKAKYPGVFAFTPVRHLIPGLLVASALIQCYCSPRLDNRFCFQSDTLPQVIFLWPDSVLRFCARTSTRLWISRIPPVWQWGSQGREFSNLLLVALNQSVSLNLAWFVYRWHC